MQVIHCRLRSCALKKHTPCTPKRASPNARNILHCRVQGAVTQAIPSNIEALLFDCDGVLVDTGRSIIIALRKVCRVLIWPDGDILSAAPDLLIVSLPSEKDGHRPSFNLAFAKKGILHEWDVDLYGRLLETGGGKERMTKFFQEVADQEPFKSTQDPASRAALVAELHKLKTDIFMELVESGAMPLRAGVKRLIGEAMAAGIPVAVCSTSNERAVSKIVEVLLGPEVAAVMRVFAGDMVKRKKPDPSIYLLAAKELGVSPSKCVVVEDSRIGMLAAKAAGMTCVITKSSYTGAENFDVADAVFDCIGDEPNKRFSLPELAELMAKSNSKV